MWKPSKGDVVGILTDYNTKDQRDNLFVVEQIDDEITSLIKGVPKRRLTYPTSRLSTLFKDKQKVADAGDTCCVCKKPTFLRTLRGEFVCVDHVKTEFLTPSESVFSALETLLPKTYPCPACSALNAPVHLHVNRDMLLRTCCQCNKNYVLSDIGNPRMHELMNKSASVVIGSEHRYKNTLVEADRRKDLPSNFTVNSSFGASMFAAVTPSSVDVLTQKDIHITLYTPYFIQIEDAKGALLKVPVADFKTLDLDPTEVVAHCSQIQTNLIGATYLGRTPLFEVVKSCSRKEYHGVYLDRHTVVKNGSKLKISNNLLSLLDHEETKLGIEHDLI